MFNQSLVDGDFLFETFNGEQILEKRLQTKTHSNKLFAKGLTVRKIHDSGHPFLRWSV